MANGGTSRRLLFVSTQPVYENANHAGGQYVFEIIRELAKTHIVDLACLTKKHGEVEKILAMKKYCREVQCFLRPSGFLASFIAFWKILFFFPFVPPDIAVYYYRSFAQIINKMVEQNRYDVIHCEYTASALYYRTKNIPAILNEHDVSFRPLRTAAKNSRKWFWKAFLLFIRSVLLERYEKKLCCRFARVLVQSSADKTALGGGANVVVYKNGIKYNGRQEGVRNKKGPLLFFGKMDRWENISAIKYFVEQIYPRIKDRVPWVKLCVAGAAPPPEIVKLKRDDIIVSGWVESLDKLFGVSSVFVSPIIIGGGIIMKNLEAMVRGLPVVTSSLGNLAIEASNGKEILIADSPEEFAAKVVELLTNEELADRIGAAGQEYVRNNFSVEKNIEKLEKIYQQFSFSADSIERLT